MNEEIKINKMANGITFINNGIAFSQFGIADEILDLISNLQQENEQLKKQKEDVVEYIKNNFIEGEVFYSKVWLKMKKKDLLRMLGEIDE